MSRLGNQHWATRPSMFLIYLLFMVVGLTGWIGALDNPFRQAPFDFAVTRSGIALFFIGGIAGMVAIWTMFWWIERTAICLLIAGMIASSIIAVLYMQSAWIQASNTAFIGAVVCGLVFRFIRVSELWVDPTPKHKVQHHDT